MLGSHLHGTVLPVVTRPRFTAADALRSSNVKSASLVLQWGVSVAKPGIRRGPPEAQTAGIKA